MELTDINKTGNYSTFNFNKSTEKFTLISSDEDSFNSFSINWIPKQTSIFVSKDLNKKYSVYPFPINGLL